MGDVHLGYYHCIECDQLFESELVPVEELICPECGHSPIGSLTEEFNPLFSSRPSQVKGIEPELAQVDVGNVVEERHSFGDIRKKSKKNGVLVLIGSWFVLSVFIVSLIKYFSAEEEVDHRVFEKQNTLDLSEQKRLIVNKALPDCLNVFQNFINAPSTVSKAQKVYQGAKLSAVMERYYKRNSDFLLKSRNFQVVWAEMLGFADRKVIGVLFKNKDDEILEVIFIQEESEWKIDWLSFVRYDPTPWFLFQTGEDGDEGEFRLYMRVRDSNIELGTGVTSLVFYKPKMHLEQELEVLPSPTVVIKSDSELGEKVAKIVTASKDRLRDDHGLIVGKIDPVNYHRVRVRLRLKKREGYVTQLEMIDIIDDNWYGIEQAKIGKGL